MREASLPFTMLFAFALTGCIGPTTDTTPIRLGYEDQSWKPAPGEALSIEPGLITIEAGAPFEGLAWTDPFPRENYELTLEATRLEGKDIFCGVVFPVGPDSCSMIPGGWDNSLLGLSMVDGLSAAENVTSYPEAFTNHVWSTVKLKVTTEAVTVKIDDKQVIDLKREAHSFSLYPGLEMYEPFGFFTYQTKALIRNPTLRALSD